MLKVGTSLTIKPTSDVFQVVCLHPAGQGGLKSPVYEVAFPFGIHRLSEELLLELFDVYLDEKPEILLPTKKEGKKNGK